MSRVLYLFLISIVFTNGQSDMKSSLTFVIDVTRSMKPVKRQVEQRANALFDAVMQSNESFIDNFVLVTFADIDENKANVNNVTITKNRDEFKDSLALTLVRGGTCPEYSLSGIETGIENSLPGSTIYIFTDASAKDFTRYKHVSDKAQKKEIQLIFVLTKTCNLKKYGHEGYDVYTKLANVTSGQVFNLHKDSVVDILKYVEDSVVARRILLAAKSFPTGDAHTLTYTSDHRTSNTTISVAGFNASIYVKGPDDEEVKVEHLVHLINVKVSKVNDTMPGTYTITIDCSTGCRVVVTAISDIQFRHGFSAFLPVSMNDTTVKPCKVTPMIMAHATVPKYRETLKLTNHDDKNYLTIMVEGNFLSQTVMLVDAFDNILPGYTMPLKPLDLDDTQKLFITAKFDTPLIMFRIVVTGLDLDYNATISRMSTVLVEPQDPNLDKPTDRKPRAAIEKSPKITVEYDTAIQLKCTVNAFPKPNITWEKNGTILETKVFSFDLPYDYVSIHKIEKVNENTTFICKATNTEGEDIQYVLVEAKPKEEFQVVEEPKDTTIEYDRMGNFKCKINAYPPAMITWFKTGKKISIEDGIQISADGSELTILHMRLNDEGNYACEVKNILEKKEISFEIKISGVDAPVIDKIAKLLNFEEGANVTLNCRIKIGIPKPNIQWYYENTVSGFIIERKEAKDEEYLLLENIKRQDQGIYKCLATNEMGNDTMETNVIVQYAPTIDNDTEPIIAKAGEAVTLTCSVDGVPKPVVKWTKDDMPLLDSKFTPTSDHRLIFVADLDDKGVYKCDVSNSLGNDSKTVNVEVEKSPKVFYKGSDPIDAEYDEPLNIPCEVLGYPKPVIVWTNIRSKTKLITDLEEKGPYHFIGYLRIEKVTENAIYRCEASNTLGNDDMEVTVRTFRKQFLNVLESPEDTTIEYDKMGNFKCKINAYPPAMITWFKTGKKIVIEDGIQISADGSELTIQHMRLNDEGNYACEVKNKVDKKEISFEIKISGVEPPVIEKFAKLLNFEEGTNVTLNCRIKIGIPKPNIQWYYENTVSGFIIERKEAKDEEYLLLENIKRQDQGIYKCLATNEMGNDTMETNVIVQYAPTIDNDTEPIIAKAGEAVTLTCSVDGVPKPVVKWTKDDMPLLDSKFTPTSDHRLIFVADLDDKGVYKCDVSNSLGNDSKTVNVEVEKSPKVFYKGSDPIDAEYDEPLNIPCEVLGYPKPVIVWTNISSKTKLITDLEEKGPHHFIGYLRIEKVTENAIYRCEASNTLGNDDMEVTVRTYRKRFFNVLESPEDKIIRYNSDDQLFCKVDAYPAAKITWYKDSKLLTVKDGVRVYPDGSAVVKFKNIQPSQKGQYTCKASNSEKTEKLMATVAISGLELPEIFKTTSEKHALIREIWVKNGATVPLSCKIIKGIPKPSIKWLRKNKYTKLFEEIKTANDQETYLVINANKNNAGEYACQANNTLGYASLKMKIKLETRRIKTKGFKTQTIYEHKTLQLHCKCKGEPKSKIKWVFEGSIEDPQHQALSLDDADTHILNIKDIKYDQRGRYTCVASNSLRGRISYTYEVDVYTDVQIHNKDGCTDYCIIRAVEGDRLLKIHCNATGHPKPHFKWTIDGFGSKEDSDTMMVFDVKKMYTPSSVTCEARNDENRFATATYKIIVDDYPSPDIPKYVMKINIGNSVAVDCPIPHQAGDLLRWYKNNRKIHEGELFINNAHTSEAGLYTCRVSGPSDSESATVLLNVVLKLTFVNKHVKTAISLKLGEKMNLDCKAQSYPIHKVSWSYNGRIISKKDTYVIKMKQAKIGKYKCEATNGLDTITRIFDVTLNECSLKIDPDVKKQPLILSHLEWPTYKYNDGYLYMPKHQSILLVCQGTSKLKIFDSFYVYAYCNKETQIEINGKAYDYSDLQCTEDVEPIVKWTGKSCFGKYSETVKIVYELGSTSVDVYEVCINSTHDIPIYAKHKLISPFADSVPKKVTWFNDRFDFNYDKIYDHDAQINGISSLMGRLWHKDDRCVFSKRQLVNSLDVFPGVPQRTTFTHLNVVPHWSTCSKNNWDDVELRVRKLLKSENDKLTVWTGTAEDLKLMDSYGTSVDIYISDQSDRRKPSQLVSTYLWKVVQNPAKQASLAIIQLNIPDITLTEARDYIKCKDMCHLTIWMKGPRWQDMNRGYVFCCELKDFEDKFGIADLKIFGNGMYNTLNK